MEPILSRFEKEVRTEFEKNNRIVSFQQYLRMVENNPRQQLRGSAQYIVDTFDYFGKNGDRFRIFDMDYDDPRYKVIDQNEVQNEIYRSLQGFVREGINNKLILLHGPNGSAKSSIINCISRGMEHYSHTPEGAMYRFNWIFPVEKVTKGSLGLGARSGTKEELDTFAFLNEDDIAAKIPCELKDHPLLLLPIHARKEFIDQFLNKNSNIYLPEYLTRGSLSQKSNQIYESLLTAYKGDLKKVLMHVQVERFYVSKRYRTAAVTIEPQMHVDAQSRQVTMDRSLNFLPPSLQSLSLFELSGDLVDGNRGVVEFADILKRPVDTYKYLLIACESGSVTVGSTTTNLDTVYIGSTNELQLDAFKEFPDFVSFKARIELIRVPYLLSYSEEQKIYDILISKIAGNKHITPHTTFVCALWAVLSRLKKPNPSIYSANVANVIAELSPIQKAKYYDHGEMPVHLTSEEKKHLKNSIQKMKEEYSNVPFYEGRMGASAREMKAILYDAAANTEFKTLSPLAVLKELEAFIKKTSEYEFLKQDIKDGYHDHVDMIEIVQEEYLNLIDREVKESMGLIQSSKYEDFLKKYIVHLSHLLKKEKVKNPITGKNEDPDHSLIDEFEKTMEAPSSAADKEAFRNNVISTIGAYALDNPNKPVEYSKVFPDFIKKLENSYFEQQKVQMRKLGETLALFGTDREDRSSDIYKLANLTIENMIGKFGYSKECAPQTILFLIKNRY